MPLRLFAAQSVDNLHRRPSEARHRLPREKLPSMVWEFMEDRLAVDRIAVRRRRHSPRVIRHPSKSTCSCSAPSMHVICRADVGNQVIAAPRVLRSAFPITASVAGGVENLKVIYFPVVVQVSVLSDLNISDAPRSGR